jgi:3-oxoacyl-[acyl-carrier protein] reductase
MSLLEGQVALVTGASRGIGKAIALRLAQAGATVVLSSRTAEAAAAAAGELVAQGCRAASVALDVSSDHSAEPTLRDLIRDYGRITVLVNNAGIHRDSLLLRMKSEDWEDVVQTDLGGVYRLCRAVVPSMVRGRYGRIVNISSVVAQSGNPGQTNYAAAKSAVEGFSRSLARELASRCITVNCVAPGFIDTDMTRALDGPARERLLEQVPMRRWGRPEEVAEAVLFLASPEASYITGVTLHVNGGMYM